MIVIVVVLFDNFHLNMISSFQIYIIISTIIVVYVILKILKGKNYFLQNLIFIGIVMLIYLYYYQDTTDTTDTTNK